MYRFFEIAMITILEATYIKCNKNTKDDDSDWNSVLIAKVHKPLDLAGKVEETKDCKVKGIVVEELLEEKGGGDLRFWVLRKKYTKCGWVVAGGT